MSRLHVWSGGDSAGDTVSMVNGKCAVIIIINQMAAIALEPLTTHPDEWAEPSHK